MSIIYLLLTISVIVAILFFVAFVISVRKGQYDDTYTPSVRILFDDEVTPTTSSSTNANQQPTNSRNSE